MARVMPDIFRQNICSRYNRQRNPAQNFSRPDSAAASSKKGEEIMGKDLRTEAADCLFDAILTLRDREECYRFFEDVCTVNELQALSQRFEVAHMLRDNRTYMDIAEITGASTATISRVNRSLNYGHDGYDLVLGRLREQSAPESAS